MDRTLRCEGRLDDGTVRLTATLPFLRLDGGVDVVLGEDGEVAAGVISKIAVDPSTSDGVPRLAVDVVLAGDTQPLRRQPARRGTRYAAADAAAAGLRAPAAVGAWCRATLVRDLRVAEERPPRRRVHGTAEIARRPQLGGWCWAAPPAARGRAAPRRDTARAS